MSKHATATVWRRFVFCAAHYLPGHPKCGQMHGHNYVVEVGIVGSVHDGMVIDFSDFKQMFEKFVHSRYDHRCLNDFEELMSIPTVENLAVAIAGILVHALRPALFPRVQTVRVYETPNCWVEVEVS